jgi:mono/diheme cytochrome c family protein
MKSAVSVAALLAAVCWSRAASPHETVTTTVLFDREIVRILNSHCVMCHMEKGPSFPLETYEQVWLQKRKISAAVLARHMPPWAAMSGYGRFANENVVTLRESQFIVSWMEGLGPRNAGKVFTNTSRPDAPVQQAVRARIDLDAWPLGRPDLVRDLEPITIDATGPNDVRRTVVDLGLAEERWVRAFEYLPGNRQVVRAAFFSVQETGQSIGSWTPWYGFVKLPQSVAFRLPPDAHVVAEIHYRHANERVVDRGRVGLFFQSARPAAVASDLVVDARHDAASNAGLQRFHTEKVLTEDTTLLALRPEVQTGLASVEVSARRADGGTDLLLFAKDIPVDWPTPFIFAEPVAIRRGTTLVVTAYASGDGKTAPPAGVRVTLSVAKPPS